MRMRNTKQLQGHTNMILAKKVTELKWVKPYGNKELPGLHKGRLMDYSFTYLYCDYFSYNI